MLPGSLSSPKDIVSLEVQQGGRKLTSVNWLLNSVLNRTLVRLSNRLGLQVIADQARRVHSTLERISPV